MSGDVLRTSWDDDPLMLPAYLGCLHWALGEDEVLARYRADTGDNFEPATNPIDKAIDRAMGRELQFLQDFSDWLERNYFGTPDDLEEV